MKYFNEHKMLPDEVDSSEQFAFYKRHLSDDIVVEFIQETQTKIKYIGEVGLSNMGGEVTFSDYKRIRFNDVAPFVSKYFKPSDKVQQIAAEYVRNYNIDLPNTCAIFYRGNDKKRECDIIPYQAFIDKAQEVLNVNPNVRFMVLPDETEFLYAFNEAFPGKCFHFHESGHMSRKDSALFYELPPHLKTAHGRYFMAAVYLASKCSNLITHSGNGGFWAVLYRGSMNGVYQFITNHIY
jgi:hypothetical protein